MRPFDEEWLRSPGDPLDPATPIYPPWQDPRPDMQGDHELWVKLLTHLFETNREIWGLFYSLRCGGCYLIFDSEANGWIVETSNEWDLAFKAKVRKKYIMPKAKEYGEALHVLANL